MSDQDIALMAHLMRRAGFGATRDELEARVANGYEATVEELLNTEEQEELDRNEMMRFPSPGLATGYTSRNGCSRVATRSGKNQAASGRENVPLLARHIRDGCFQS
ncbi:MAG: hypothetical protein CM1200mP27_08680 [Chloroflexota bacterium]|nr:MAG: hypothetical protein CM1200mP27_08680 [Chloroflexota bacterium]